MKTIELKTVCSHTMSVLLHLSDVHCKCFPYHDAMASKNMQRTNRQMKVSYVGC